MSKIKKFDEFINESVYDENDGFTSSVSQHRETPTTKTPLPDEEVKKLREKLNDISDCVTAIIKKDEKEIKENIGVQRGMMVCCKAGAGLTYSIENAVSKANGTSNDLFTIPADIKISESLLYRYLQKYNNKLIVIEDFERILNDYDCCLMLKKALSKTERERIISTSKFAPKFTFNGYIMFTSHKKIEEIMKKYGEQLDGLIARCYLFDIFPDEKFSNTYIDRKRNY